MNACFAAFGCAERVPLGRANFRLATIHSAMNQHSSRWSLLNRPRELARSRVFLPGVDLFRQAQSLCSTCLLTEHNEIARVTRQIRGHEETAIVVVHAADVGQIEV